MSLGRPSAKITIDGRGLTAAEAGLVRLSVEMTPGSHDAADLVLWPGSKFAGTAPGAVISVALGTAGAEEDVWTGEAVAVHAAPEGVAIEGLAATAALSRARLTRTYVGQTVADIVRDLAGEAGIDQVEAALELSAYSIDGRRTVWAHLTELARLAGADLGCGAAGGLRFVPRRTGPATRTLRHGADLLDWSVGRAAAPAAPTVVAHGAGSEAGAKRWHWILNDPAGPGGAGAAVAAFRTRAGAEAMTEALAARAARLAVRGVLRIVGDPALRVGDLIGIEDLPGPNPGTLRVLSMQHLLDMRAGFVTSLAVEGAGGAGLPGVPGL